MGNETKTKPLTEMAEFLTGQSDRLAHFTEPHNAQRLIRLALVATRQDVTGKLLNSSWTTVLTSLITAARWGLEPATAAGVPADCYLVPWWDKRKKTHLVGLMPSYRGLTKLVCQSGEVKRIRSHVVYESDRFEIHQGSEPRIDHVLALADRGHPVGVYAIARMSDGADEYEWVPWSDVEKAKSCAKGAAPAWAAWPDQMARKVAIKRICNQLPMAPIAREAIAVDHAVADSDYEKMRQVIDVDGDGQVVDVGGADVPRETRSSGLADKIRRSREPEVDVELDPDEADPPEPEFCGKCGVAMISGKSGAIYCPQCDEIPF